LGFVGLGRTDVAPTVLLSSDGRTWAEGSLPGDLHPGSWVNDPTAFSGGYVLPGTVLEQGTAEISDIGGGGTPGSGGCIEPGPNDNPPTYRGAVWWSPDGSNWTRATLDGTIATYSVNMTVLRIDDHTLVATQRAWSADAVKQPNAAWISHDGKAWAPLQGFPVDNGGVVSSRSHGVIYLTDNRAPLSKLYTVSGDDTVVPLTLNGQPPSLAEPQMALGPAGLLVTDDGTQFWLGVPK
jgi:hypothetical protein